MLESDRNQGDEAVRITTLMENLNNLKSKLNHFTVMDELGQPIGEIQDLILDDTHQLNLVIATLGAPENNSSVLLNGRRIKKVSVQTHAVFVDIVKADVDFLPQYTPLASSAPSESAALMGESAIAHPAPQDTLSIPEDTLSLEDDSFTSSSLFTEPADDFSALEDDSFTADSLFADPTDDFSAPEDDSFTSSSLFTEPADDFSALEDDSFTADSLFADPTDDFSTLEDDLFASEPLMPEPADDFSVPVERSSMESLESDNDWLSTDPSADQNNLVDSLELPELSEIELSPLENFSLDSESTAGFITNNSLEDDWSELVSPIDQPGLGYGTLSEDISLPDFSDDAVETPAFSLEADEQSESGFASWESAPQDSSTEDSLTDVEIGNEFELPASSSFVDSFSVDAINENADEFLLSADFDKTEPTPDLALEGLSDLDASLDLDASSEAMSLDDFGFPDTALTPLEDLSLDDFGFSDRSTTDDLASELPSLDLNLGESLADADPGLSWVDETENELESDELFELNPDDSLDLFQAETGSGLELGLADELADLNLSVDSTDLEFETNATDLDSTDLEFETNAIASLPNLDFSLDDNFADDSADQSIVDQSIVDQSIVDQSISDIDLGVSEMPTSFVEVSVDAIAPSVSQDLANLELDTAFDVDLSLEDEFGADFAIAEPNDPSESLQDDRVEPELETTASLTTLEFTDDLPTDTLATTFGSVADLSFAEAGELAELTNLGAELETVDFALDSLFDNPVDNPESVADEFNFSTSTMGFVDPAAGMAAASGILAGLAGLTGGVPRDRSPQPTEEISPLDSADINADISDMSNVPAQESLEVTDPPFDLTVNPIVSEKVSEKPIVSGTFKSPKVANAVIDAIAETLRHRCKSIRIEIELDDSSLTQSYQAWLDECSDL
jgi:hypothetical protein